MKIIKKKGNIVKILIIMLIATISLYILSISSYAADSGGKTESGVGGGFGEIIESITDDYVTKSDGKINPDDYKPKYADQTIGSYRIKTMANRIIGTIQIIGSILSVAVLGILGIKYMIGSVEERAEYKKTLKAYVIGAVMVFGIVNILGIIVKIATNVFS